MSVLKIRTPRPRSNSSHHIRLLQLLVAVLVLCWFGAKSASADPRADRMPVLAQNLRVAVVTFGPGDHPFAKFGHDAIWVELPDGRGAIYNFGTFGGETSSLLTKFLQGRFNYWLSVSRPAETLHAYKRDDRSVIIQDLALSQSEKLDLWRRLEVNARPENREYLYDYFKDNCSTRVRDAIDATLKGALKKALLQKPARLNFRQHALRLASDLPWLYVGLHFGLAQEADQPRNRWEEGFIPAGVQDSLASYSLSRGALEVPLVEKTSTFYQATRAPSLNEPPTTWPWFLLAGLGLGGVLFGLGSLAMKSRMARVTFGTLAALLSLVCGLLGVVLLFLWLFTNHQIAFKNENLAFCPPWLLVSFVSSLGLALGSQRLMALTRSVFRWTLGLAVLAVVLKLTPWFFQSNKEFACFFLPLWTALAVTTHRLLEAAQAASPVKHSTPLR